MSSAQVLRGACLAVEWSVWSIGDTRKRASTPVSPPRRSDPPVQGLLPWGTRLVIKALMDTREGGTSLVIKALLDTVHVRGAPLYP